MSKVSVIIPIFNCEKYLERCVLSIINQSLKDIEIILVNDGSKDKSLNICEKFANIDNRIIIIDKKNEGVGIARNEGIKIAKGEYIAFVDSDDFVELNFLEHLYNRAIKKNADICGCLYDEYKNGKYVSIQDLNTLKICGERNGKQFLNYFYNPSSSYESICCIVVWNKIYKTELIKNILFSDKKSAEDEEFSFKIMQESKKIYMSNKVLYHYFSDNQNSLTNKPFGIHKLDFLKILEERKSLIRSNKYLYNKNLYLLCNISIEYFFKMDGSSKNYNKKIFNVNFKELLDTKGVKMKDKVRFFIFYISPNLYKILTKI